MADRTVTYRFRGDVSPLTSSMARAGAEAERLDRRLDSVDATTIHTSRSIATLGQNVQTASGQFRDANGRLRDANGRFASLRTEVDGLGGPLRRSSSDLNQFTGRMGLLIRLAAGLGPALLPISAVAVPAVTGLATAFAAVGAAGGTAMLAFAGMGDAFGALNQFQLEPTAENLTKMEQAFDKLGPAGENFVRSLDDLSPALDGLQRTAGAGLFPGLLDGIDQMTGALPEVREFISEIASVTGNLASDAASSLASDDDLRAFFEYLQSDAAPTLDQFARSAGNFTAGLANIMTAFAPLSRDFNSGMLEMSRSFREWSAGLSDSQGFQDFLDYIREAGPQVGEFLSAVGRAVVGLAEALAPWGSAVLPILTAVAEAFAAIASSPIGPALATAAIGMATLGRATRTIGGAVGQTRTSLVGMRNDFRELRNSRDVFGPMTAGATRAQDRINKLRGAAVPGAAAIGAMALMSSGAAEDMGMMNAMTLTMAGSMVGPWGAGAGFMVGTLIDLKARLEDGAAAGESFHNTLSKPLSISGLQSAITEFQTAGGAGNAAFGSILSDVAPERMAEAARKLADAYGVTITATRGTAEETAQLDRILEQAAPAMAALGISTEDIIRAAGDGTLDQLVGQIQRYGDGSQASAAKVLGLKQSMEEVTAAAQRQSDALLAAIDASVAFERSLDELSNAKGNDAGLSEETEKGRQNIETTTQAIKDYNAELASKSPREALGDYRDLRREIRAFGERTNATEAEVARMLRTVQKPAILRITSNAIREKDRVRELGKYLKDIPPEVITDMKANGLPRTRKDVLDLADKYDSLDKKDIKTLMSLVGAGLTQKQLREIDRLLDKLDGKKPKPKVTADTGRARSLLDSVGKTIHDIDRQRPKPKVSADIGSLRNNVGAAERELNGVDRKRPKPKLSADIGSLMSSSGTAQRALREVGAMHPSPRITVTSNASEVAGSVTSILNGIGDEVVNIYTRRVGGNALGGIWKGNIRTFAAGGMDVANAHPPHIAAAGTMRLFAEPETRGESYIPHARDHRLSRSIDIWEQTGRILGVQFERYADGGMNRALDTQASRSMPSRPSGRRRGGGSSTIRVAIGGPVDLVLEDGTALRALMRAEAEDVVLAYDDMAIDGERADW